MRVRVVLMWLYPFVTSRYIITKKIYDLGFVKIPHRKTDIYVIKPTESLKILILGKWGLEEVLNQF